MPKERVNRHKNREQSKYFFDYSMLLIVLFLLGFGLLMIYSASSYTSFAEHQDAAFYLKKQARNILIGIPVMALMAMIPYEKYAKFAFAGYIVSFLCIPLVKTPLGEESHGATRWVRIPGLGMNVQPAELAKMFMILFLAVVVCKMGKSIRTLKGFLVMLAIPLPIVLEVYFLTNNLSSAIIIMGISVFMVFVASPDYKKFILIALTIIALAVLLVVLVKAKPELLGFRGDRIKAWLDPESYSGDKSYQTLQGLYAIGSGGVWGKGLGQSMQKMSFLPEAQNDMIFSVICEELGLFGGICIILLFVMLLWRMMMTANNAPDLFGAMLVVGVMGHIAIQAILNIAVVTASIPNTGITLPFISYGGSSIVFLMAEIGAVMSVARRAQRKNIT